MSRFLAAGGRHSVRVVAGAVGLALPVPSAAQHDHARPDSGWGGRTLEGRPFVEVGYHVPRATRRPTPLDPVEVFGDDHVSTVSLSVRMQAGYVGRRFGRHGVADSSTGNAS